MKGFLLRVSLTGTIVVALFIWLPVIVGLLWVTNRRPDLIDAFSAQPAPVRGAMVAGGLAVLLALQLAVAAIVAWRGIGRVTGWMSQLTTVAERFGAGPEGVAPLHTGLREIDRISEILARASHRVQGALAAERSFASDASHQLRTPLTALLMRLEEISTTDQIEVAREEAAVAIAQVDRLTTVVEDLLMRRRRDPDEAQPQVSLDSVIASLQREWQPAFEKARRSVRVHGERGLVVKATPVALSQVLSTLLENSLAHGRGTVDVYARRSGPSVVVEVRDEGDGVPITMAPHIFERSVSSGGGTSTGLGLALARDLAESCGGRLDLVSVRPAKFALFLSEGDVIPDRISAR